MTIESVQVSVYTIPTESAESDGTLEWDRTTLVLVEVAAGGKVGLGFTYSSAAAAHVIHERLAPLLKGQDALDIEAHWFRMLRSIRNLGRPGICASAISAVDNALWDLKARIHEVPLFVLLGRVRDEIPIYGSGGFTSYSIPELQRQLGGWVSQGITRVKMKVGRNPNEDILRVREARESIGRAAELFVDANGAYSRKQALAFAGIFITSGVQWFEEPVSSDDLEGLHLLRERCPAGMEIAAGEYGYDPYYFRRMLEHEAVDVLQADATRCMGITGLLKASALCEARGVPLSAHTAPSMHLHPCCALIPMRHLEYFHDHTRIERMLFDGVAEPVNGALRPIPRAPDSESSSSGLPPGSMPPEMRCRFLQSE